MPPPRWGLGDAALAVVAGYLLSGVTFVLFAAVTGAREDSLGTTAAGLVGLWLGLGGVTWLAARRKGSGSVATDFGFFVQGWADLYGAGVGFLSQLVLVPVLTLPVYQFIEDASEKLREPAQELSSQAGDDLGFFVLAVFLVVGAPVIEELFYRGLLLRSLERRFNPAIAIVGSGLLFGAAHVRPDAIGWLAQMPALAGFGMVLAVVAHRAKRLGPGIIAHAVFNLVTVLILFANRSS